MIDAAGFARAMNCPESERTILENEPMGRHTSFHIGGPADVLVQPKTERAIIAAVRAARENDIPLTVLGNGSNVLVRDEGIRGVVLAIGQEYGVIAMEGHKLEAQTGALLAVLAAAARAGSLTGLEFAAGIPGSLGGALFMDAGAYGGQMADVVETTRYLNEKLEICELHGEQHEFGYRTSVFRTHPEWIALSAVMALQPGNPAEIQAKMNDFAQRRRDKQPLNYPSAGSTFKRPEGHFAGKLIQDAGLMGYTVGGAQVSEKHAGFVVNRGEATCADVLAVIDHVREEVLRQFGVELEPEVRLL